LACTVHRAAYRAAGIALLPCDFLNLFHEVLFLQSSSNVRERRSLVAFVVLQPELGLAKVLSTGREFAGANCGHAGDHLRHSPPVYVLSVRCSIESGQ